PRAFTWCGRGCGHRSRRRLAGVGTGGSGPDRGELAGKGAHRLRSAPIVTVFGAVLDQESATRAALDEFVAGVGVVPAKSNYVAGPYREIKRYLAEYEISSGERRPVEREAGHSYSKSEFFRRELPANVIAQLLARFAQGRW